MLNIKNFINKISVISILLITLKLNAKENIEHESKKSYDKPTTVFIHGTLYPPITFLIRGLDLPLGLSRADTPGRKFIQGRIPLYLNEVDPTQFPLDTFYFFGWSGRLNFWARRKAAIKLYNCIKDFKNLTIMAHSHGCNVALNLASVAQDAGDTQFSVERLILLACPVVDVTKDKINSPIFKEKIAFYSNGDRTVIADPQGLTRCTRAYARASGEKTTFFSRRLFPDYPGLIQRRVLIGRRNPEHLDFIFEPFIRSLPFTLDLVRDSSKRGLANNCDHQYLINVPRNLCAKPELLVKSVIR